MDGNANLNAALMRDRKVLGWDSIIGYVGEGMLMELGVWRGISFREICTRAYPRKVYGFDWFNGLPERWDDGRSGLPNDVDEMSMGGTPPPCPENGQFIIGLVQDTLPYFVRGYSQPIAFVHFDLDLYSSTKCGLDHLGPYFRPGTVLAFDEIDGAVRNVNHEQAAFREWLKDHNWDMELLGQRHYESWVVRLK
jgi:hypothetical protein